MEEGDHLWQVSDLDTLGSDGADETACGYEGIESDRAGGSEAAQHSLSDALQGVKNLIIMINIEIYVVSLTPSS